MDSPVTPFTDSNGEQPDEAAATAALDPVELKVEVVIGRARLTLAELRSLHPNDYLQLDRPSNGPVDVLVNGLLMAKGEISVIDETNFGVRILEIVTR
jgi:flagellar motor switch protein FliN/FliY